MKQLIDKKDEYVSLQIMSPSVKIESHKSITDGYHPEDDTKLEDDLVVTEIEEQIETERVEREETAEVEDMNSLNADTIEAVLNASDKQLQTMNKCLLERKQSQMSQSSTKSITVQFLESQIQSDSE